MDQKFWREPTINSDALYARLREEIISGERAPSELLAELRVAKQFEVSRTPVREALRRLEQDGLVERTASGTRVRARSPEEIIEIFDVRILLEGAATRGAAMARTPLDMVRLRQALVRMQATPSDPRERARVNRDLHELIWACAHNLTLFDLNSRLRSHLARYPDIAADERWTEALREHEEIVDAIEAQDGDRAERLARGHMRTARDLRIRLFAEAEDQSN